MKLSIQLDVDLGTVKTRRWLRRGLLLGLPVAVMAVAGNVLGVPNEFMKDTKLSASAMNANFEFLEKRSATEWAIYADCKVVDRSAPATAVGNDTTTCLSRTVGDSLEVRIYTEWANGSPPTAGHIMAWTLPEGTVVDQTKLPKPSSYRNVLGVANVNMGLAGIGAAVVSSNVDQPSVLVAVHGAADALNSSSVSGNTLVELNFSVPIVQP